MKDMGFAKKKTIIIVLSLLGAVLLMGGAAASFYYGLFDKSEGFPKDAGVTISNSNEGLFMSWDELKLENLKAYKVEIFDQNDVGTQSTEDGKKKDTRTPLFSQTYDPKDIKYKNAGPRITLPKDKLADKAVDIIVTPVVTREVFGKQLEEESEERITSKCNLRQPDEPKLSYSVDLTEGNLNIICKGCSQEQYTLYLEKADGEKNRIAYLKKDQLSVVFDESSEKASAGNAVAGKETGSISLDSDDILTVSLKFGENALRIPEENEKFTFTIEAGSEYDRAVYNVNCYEPAVLSRNDFLSDALYVKTDEKHTNSYILSWNETKGSGYLIQKKDDGEEEWKTVKELSATDERKYETGNLKPCSRFSYRIIPIGYEDKMKELDFETEASAIYSTVWPTTDLAVYDSPEGDNQIGAVATLTPLSVMDDKEGRFLIRTGMGKDDIEGYINSSYCLINLPDYLGDLCRYDITNSYGSIYLAHEYPIPAVSGTVVTGYEHVLMADGTFLVPLLYPVARRLVPAAKTAREEGFVLKIYDSFRPYVATRSIYDLTSQCLDYVVPGSPFSRISPSDYLNGARANVIALDQLEKIVPVDPKATGTDAEKARKINETKTTYSKVMLNNGQYSMGEFLAASGSTHNLGIAMDMTLESLSTGEELDAQTRIHDLSWYSIQANNNANAEILKRIMTNEGFGMIPSEWWHFQDNETRSALQPVTVNDGVSVNGWKKDDKGWKYMTADGSLYKDREVEILGATYRFDEDGYLIENN